MTKLENYHAYGLLTLTNDYAPYWSVWKLASLSPPSQRKSQRNLTQQTLLVLHNTWKASQIFPWKFNSVISRLVETTCNFFYFVKAQKILMSQMERKKERKLLIKKNNIIKTTKGREKCFWGFIKNIERQFFNKHKICCETERERERESREVFSHKIQFLFCLPQHKNIIFCTTEPGSGARREKKLKQNTGKQREREICKSN